jgi:hypothetical protein
MRLLNARSITLYDFLDNKIPPYTILLHRWENEEASFQDMLGSSAPEKAKDKIHM